MLMGVVLGSLSNELDETDYNQLTNVVVPALKSPIASMVLKGPMRIFGSNHMRPAFQTAEGRQYARRLSIMDLKIEEFYREPIVLILTTSARVGAFERKMTTEERQVVRKTVELGFHTFIVGKRNLWEASNYLLPMWGAWWDIRGMIGPAKWRKVAQSLSPELRSHMAYVFGMRFLKRKKPDMAATFFRTAIRDSPADSMRHKLSKAELERIENQSKSDDKQPTPQK